MESSEEELEVDPQTQEIYWKIEAILIRAMKAKPLQSREELLSNAVATLNRPQVNHSLFVNRLDYLIKREWFDAHEGQVRLREVKPATQMK
jgi:hypothetical protein